MEPHQQVADADSRSRTGSETRLLVPQRAGGSNSRALKIAGLTTLVCALLASQIFTAVMVLDQNKQIDNLQRKSEQMGRDLSRAPKGVPKARMQVPLRSLPMVMDIPIDSETKKPQAPPQPPAPEPVVSMEEQVKGFIQDFDLPSFNETFLANLEGLKKNIQEEEWKSFESWMRYWLIFKMAQDKPEMTKCQEEMEHASKLGSFKPQCDEHGDYKPRQCWHATGFCWCVDKSGKTIQGTTTRGWPQCA
ncbi:HLA class II histocompatibility antigen gamma chain-like isoform X2 [Nelusetta ayraudi]|uniref:HLA class II histocompatibility antigen gamma chain-like isoform X2 n=1 Tax=Nelusetta ayraudi TaxID=303726 RepID=UPI003F6FA80E